MIIYKLGANHDEFDACQVEYHVTNSNITTRKRPFRFDGSPQKELWKPAKVTRYNEMPLGDYISKLSNDAIIMRKTAIEKIRGIAGSIEVLPLDCDFGDYRLINVLDVIDCVDYENSDYDTFSTSANFDGRPKIMTFNQISFFAEKIKGHHLFKIIDLPKSVIYVDDVFVTTIAEHRITGFAFEKVWEG